MINIIVHFIERFVVFAFDNAISWFKSQAGHQWQKRDLYYMVCLDLKTTKLVVFGWPVEQGLFCAIHVPQHHGFVIFGACSL